MKTVVFSANCELFLPSSQHQHAGDQNDLAFLGQAVRRLREQQGLSADELANTTGMTRQRIDLLEAGRLDPTYELLLALADGLGIQLSGLAALAARIAQEAGQP